MAQTGTVPLIDVAPLFDADPAAWVLPDQALAAAARDSGFAHIREGCWVDVPPVEGTLIFYEARAEATIAPLPLDPPDLFAAFEYGEFLWKRMRTIIEFRGMPDERARAHR